MKVDGLDGRVAIVTGGARGIGLAIAESLAANGMKLALFDLERQQVEEAAVCMPLGLGIEVDVSSWASVKNGVAQVENRLGPVHVLVNNAGIIFWKTFEEGTEAEWDRMMAINAKGVYLCCRAVYESMKTRREGCIVNITSSAGKRGSPACPHYSASKAAVLNFTVALAADLAEFGVRVNGVAPALIDTEMFRARDASKLSPIGRMGRPSEVADAVCFLCSSNASFITGEILDVNGGFLMD